MHFGPFQPSQFVYPFLICVSIRFDQCFSENPTYSPANLGAKLFDEVLTATNIKVICLINGYLAFLCDIGLETFYYYCLGEV